MDVRRADERYPGGDEAAGIASRHAFSFGPH
ncbi:pirin family protein, partial [Streptomyces sp. SID5914]|nr:pirin family protein [Streptomyces sp. SID5914]